MFKKATKEAAKLRAAIFGPSGAGKTFTSLRLATGMGGRIAVIDSERRTASKYADRFDFEVCDLGSGQHRISDYVTAIRAAGEAGFDVLVIDSLTHAWQELLTEIDAIAKEKYRGNTWSAWSDGTPKQKALIDAILDFPGHVIATMRSKTEWTTEKEGGSGKSAPRRVGLTPEQGKGIEYEFDMLFELSVEHILTVLKDRSGKFQDQIIDSPGEALGAEMRAWLDEGAPPMSIPDQITAKARAVGLTVKGMASLLCQCGVSDLPQLKPAVQAQVLNTALNNPATIQAWNAGVDSRTGAPLALADLPYGRGGGEPEAAAAKPEPTAVLWGARLQVDHEGHPQDLTPDEDSADDPDDPPAVWDLDD